MRGCIISCAIRNYFRNKAIPFPYNKMNSSLSQQKLSPFHALSQNCSPTNYNNVNSKAALQSETVYKHTRTGSNNQNAGSNACADRSPMARRQFKPCFRSDSASHLTNKRSGSNNYSENVKPKHFHHTEKIIKTAVIDSSNENTLYDTSTTMKQIQNFVLVRKSSFHPTRKDNKKSTRTSIFGDVKVDGTWFDILRPIGKGKYGRVFLVRNKYTGFLLALKSIEKKKIRQANLLEQFIRQLKIQFYLNHPGIVKLYGFFDDPQNLYLLMELGCDGQLYDKISGKYLLNEESSSFVARSMLEVVEYMHSEKVLHRDIKPENIVVILGHLKICDFGWAVYNNTEMRSTFCGTPLYFSPELLSRQQYDQKVDLWAIGVMIFQLALGKSPFNLKQPQDLGRIVTHSVEFPKGKQINNQFKEFILMILQKNPEKRPTSKQLLKTNFIKKYSNLQICEQLCRDNKKIK